MDFSEEEPELAGYEPTTGRPMRGRRKVVVLRVVVLVGLAALILPGIITTVSVGQKTAQSACAIWVAYEVPDAPSSDARFELFGEGTVGWECYTVDAFGGDRHVASLGLIPGAPVLPTRSGDSTES